MLAREIEFHLDEKKTARNLNVSVAWRRKQRSLGKNGPPFRKFGNLVRYPIEELREWAKLQEVR